MSINSMTNSAAGRRSDLLPAQGVPSNVSEIAVAARTAPTPVPDGSTKAADGTVAPAPVNTALNLLFGYIPTEVVTLYVAVLAASEGASNAEIPGMITFCTFLALTPLVVWVVFATKMKAINKPLPWRFRALPIWEMFAASSAFTAWVFALPKSPFLDYSWYSPAFSALAVLIASTLLGLLAPLFQRELEP